MDIALLKDTAQKMVATGKGILAADESHPTIGKRFAALGIENSEETRRTYRQMFFHRIPFLRLYSMCSPLI